MINNYCDRFDSRHFPISRTRTTSLSFLLKTVFLSFSLLTLYHIILRLARSSNNFHFLAELHNTSNANASNHASESAEDKKFCCKSAVNISGWSHFTFDSFLLSFAKHNFDLNLITNQASAMNAAVQFHFLNSINWLRMLIFRIVWNKYEEKKMKKKNK